MVVTMRQVMTRDGELYVYRPIPPLCKTISGDDYSPMPTGAIFAVSRQERQQAELHAAGEPPGGDDTERACRVDADRHVGLVAIGVDAPDPHLRDR